MLRLEAWAAHSEVSASVRVCGAAVMSTWLMVRQQQQPAVTTRSLAWGVIPRAKSVLSFIDQTMYLRVRGFTKRLDPRQLHVNATRLNTHSADGEAAGGLLARSAPSGAPAKVQYKYIHGKYIQGEG